MNIIYNIIKRILRLQIIIFSVLTFCVGCIERDLVNLPDDGLLYLSINKNIPIDNNMHLLLYRDNLDNENEAYQYTLPYKDTIIGLPSGNYRACVYNSVELFTVNNVNDYDNVNIEINSENMHKLKNLYVYSQSRKIVLNRQEYSHLEVFPIAIHYNIYLTVSITGNSENVFETIEAELSGLVKSITLSNCEASSDNISISSGNIMESSLRWNLCTMGFSPVAEQTLKIKILSKDTTTENIEFSINLNEITKNLKHKNIKLNPVIKIEEGEDGKKLITLDEFIYKTYE